MSSMHLEPAIWRWMACAAQSVTQGRVSRACLYKATATVNSQQLSPGPVEGVRV